MMNKSNPFRHLAVAVFACLMAASCSDVTDDGTALPDGKYPMTFTASVDGLSAPNPASRATTDADGKTTWQTDDPVAISMDGGANHKVHKISDAGTGAMIPDGETLYWSKQQETLAAWYPVNYIIGNGGGSEVSITDQSSGFVTLENALHAPAQEYTYSSGGSVAFTFRHALAKVKVALKKGEGITDNDLSGATVTFMGYTAGSLGYDGMTGSEGSNGDISPKVETPADGGAATYTALVIPQQMQGKKFIKVTIGTGNAARDYFYTPTGNDDANLEAGKQYTYTITVKKTGLEVAVASIPAWGNGGETTGGSEASSFSVKIPTVPGVTPTIDGATGDAGEIYTTTDNSFSITLSVGDGMTGFSIKGGVCDVKRTAENGSYKSTYSNIRSDLELVYRDYAEVGDYYNDDGAWSKYYDGTKSIGIVFKVGAAQGDVASNYDNKLPDGIHGYVVALQDALSTAGNWGKRGVDTPITDVNDASVTAYTGYSDTRTIISTYSGGSTWSDYQAFKAIVDYRSNVPAPGTSSDWYLPSLAQLGDVHSALGTIGTPLATAGQGFTTDATTDNGWYWTSSEKTNSGWDAWHVSFRDGSKGSNAKDGTNYDSGKRACYARAILTF